MIMILKNYLVISGEFKRNILCFYVNMVEKFYLMSSKRGNQVAQDESCLRLLAALFLKKTIKEEKIDRPNIGNFI